MFRTGDRVGDYDIVARMKSGGMATLYLARRRGASGFQKHVAIKVVHQHLAEDPVFARMFVDEALLSAKIHHPNVVHVEELREIEGQHFLVMEFVPGCSLGQLMRGLAKRRRRLTTALAVHIALRVADGLHAAHELKDHEGQLLGVVHRDVTPENVLLAWQGHVKLIDFGVAKARMRSEQTTGKALKGKLRYMAPEQALGKDVDRRTDIYTLGICMWEMLTMRRMFSGENDFAMLDEVRHPKHRAPSSLVTSLEPALDAVVLKALAPDPNERFDTARELRRELARVVPSALALESADLSELLHAIMGEQIAKQRKRLARKLGEKEPAPEKDDPAAEEEVLKTMTVSALDIEYFDDFPSENVKSAAILKQGAVPPPPPPKMPLKKAVGASLRRSSAPPSSKSGLKPIAPAKIAQKKGSPEPEKKKDDESKSDSAAEAPADKLNDALRADTTDKDGPAKETKAKTAPADEDDGGWDDDTEADVPSDVSRHMPIEPDVGDEPPDRISLADLVRDHDGPVEAPSRAEPTGKIITDAAARISGLAPRPAVSLPKIGLIVLGVIVLAAALAFVTGGDEPAAPPAEAAAAEEETATPEPEPPAAAGEPAAEEPAARAVEEEATAAADETPEEESPEVADSTSDEEPATTEPTPTTSMTRERSRSSSSSRMRRTGRRTGSMRRSMASMIASDFGF